jgi:type III restriction enzyme
VIVYDESQNLSDQRIDLLLEVEPDALFVASATRRLPAKLGRIINELKDVGWNDTSLVTVVPPGVVALSGLIKDALSIGGYQSPMEQTIDEMLADLEKATRATEAELLPFRPKAIYVCKTNIVEGNSLQRDDPKRPLGQRQAPPILIWRYLVEERGVDPKTIAAYCSLESDRSHPARKDFVLFKGGDADYADFVAGDFRHIIFNLSLQEGWDDPSCYFTYIDKSMGSSVQVEQLVGRVLRQPAARPMRPTY